MYTIEVDAADMCMIYRGLRASTRRICEIAEDSNLGEDLQEFWAKDGLSVMDLYRRLEEQVPESSVNPAMAYLVTLKGKKRKEAEKSLNEISAILSGHPPA